MRLSELRRTETFGLLVIVLSQLDPAWVGAAAGGVSVGTVHADPRAWIDVKLAVNDQLVARVSGDVGGQGRVVVDLEHLARGRLHLKALMPSGFDGVVHDGG